jgi:hypothetical protein
LALRIDNLARSIDYGSTASSWLLFGATGEPIAMFEVSDDHLRRACEETGAVACAHIGWMMEQGTFIADVALYGPSIDPRALMGSALKSTTLDVSWV